eukprot:COSAG05_NODE_2931_length_2491_cov_2.005853_2_plen_525_part_01
MEMSAEMEVEVDAVAGIAAEDSRGANDKDAGAQRRHVFIGPDAPGSSAAARDQLHENEGAAMLLLDSASRERWARSAPEPECADTERVAERKAEIEKEVEAESRIRKGAKEKAQQKPEQLVGKKRFKKPQEARKSAEVAAAEAEKARQQEQMAKDAAERAAAGQDQRRNNEGEEDRHIEDGTRLLSDSLDREALLSFCKSEAEAQGRDGQERAVAMEVLQTDGSSVDEVVQAFVVGFQTKAGEKALVVRREWERARAESNMVAAKEAKQRMAQARDWQYLMYEKLRIENASTYAKMLAHWGQIGLVMPPSAGQNGHKSVSDDSALSMRIRFDPDWTRPATLDSAIGVSGPELGQGIASDRGAREKITSFALPNIRTNPVKLGGFGVPNATIGPVSYITIGDPYGRRHPKLSRVYGKQFQSQPMKKSSSVGDNFGTFDRASYITIGDPYKPLVIDIVKAGAPAREIEVAPTVESPVFQQVDYTKDEKSNGPDIRRATYHDGEVGLGRPAFVVQHSAGVRVFHSAGR